MQMTRHATNRCLERRLPSHILQTICVFGVERRAKGACSLMLDASSIALAAEGDRNREQELERYRGAYVILSDTGLIITAARRTRRFRN